MQLGMMNGYRLALLALLTLAFGCVGGGDGDGSGDNGSVSTGDNGDNGGGASSGDSGGAGSGGSSLFGGTPGGGSGSGGGSVDLGMDDSAQLSSLDASGAQALCDAVADVVDRNFSDQRLLEFSCGIAGIAAGTVGVDDDGNPMIDVSACQAATDACVDAGLDAETSSTTSCDAAEVMTAAQECDATIGELESCLGAGLSLLSDVLDLLSCQNLSDPAALESAAEPFASGEIPGCEDLEARCPGIVSSAASGMDLFGDSGSSGGQPDPSGCDSCFFSLDGECDEDGTANGLCAPGTDCTDCNAN